MALPKVLMDSNFLYTLFHRADPAHQKVRNAFATIEADFIIPQVVLTETAWLFNCAGGMLLVANFLDLFATMELPLEMTTYDDLHRVSALMRQYPGTKLELVDCCIVAMAERLNITRVATLDRRDFSIIRMRDGNFLDTIP